MARRRGRAGRACASHRFRVPGADADAVGDGCRQRAPAAEARRPYAGRARSRRGRAGARRARGFRRQLSARIVRRHADARLDRACARHRARPAADGRAVRGARRDHALPPQQRSLDALALAAQDRRVRHPFGVRIGLPLATHRRDDAASRPRLHRDRDRRALSARRALPHVGGLCRALPDRVGGAGAGDGRGA